MKGVTLVYSLLVCAVAVSASVNQCPPEQSTNWNIEQLLPHEDCDKFYMCTHGQPVEKQCNENLYFNINTWQCDWPANVDCTGRNVGGSSALPTTIPTTVPTTLPTTPPTTQPPTTQPPTTQPPTTQPPTTQPPTTQPPTTQPPPTQPPTTQPPTTQPPTTQPPNSGFLPNGCPVNPHVHWLLPHESDCTQFYYCVWGQLVARQCAPGTHFNRYIQICDWPYAAGCATGY